MKRALIAGLMAGLFAGMMLLVIAASGVAVQGQGGTTCDRDCLRGFVSQYLTAMVSHNPAPLPTTPTARFTENTQTLKLGEGLWKDVSGIRPYLQDFIDVSQGTTVSHVIVEEGGTPVMLVLRLKIDNKKISEIETM